MIDIDRTLKYEGGFVHHPLDRGGPTNKGITMGALSRHLGREVTEEDIRKITADDAWKFYALLAKRYKIDKIKCSREVSSHQVADQVFDAAVHHGPRQAGLWLQRSIGGLKVDGIIGSRTLAAARKANAREVNNQIMQRRVQFMAHLVARRPEQSVFISGWVRRALSYMV